MTASWLAACEIEERHACAHLAEAGSIEAKARARPFSTGDALDAAAAGRTGLPVNRGPKGRTQGQIVGDGTNHAEVNERKQSINRRLASAAA